VEAQAKSQHHHEGGIRPHKITVSQTKHELLNNELLTAWSIKDSITMPMKRLANKVAVKQGVVAQWPPEGHNDDSRGDCPTLNCLLRTMKICIEEYMFFIFLFAVVCVKLKDNSGTKRTFGLITHWYLVNYSLRFVFMIIKCKVFYCFAPYNASIYTVKNIVGLT